jgi:tetratricopeptide (TPR) repeat protein
MKKSLITIIGVFGFQLIFGQPNCVLCKDATCVKACEISIKAAKYPGSKYSQELFDQAIALCPSFAYAYFEKSIPYLKQGLFKEWKALMDKAVKYDPSYLLNRGCNQIQFIRNYEMGVKDLDSLVALKKTIEIGFNPSGEYHAQLLRAISYQKLGNLDKAIELVEELLNSKNYYQGPFDYFHIGIIHL